MRTPRIGIIGSYGGFNLGDEAILQVITRQLRASSSAEITVFSRNADDTRRRHPVDRVVPARELSRAEVAPEIERLDLLILGGGGLLYDAEAHLYLREVALAEEAGVPVVAYAIGAGPLQDPEARKLVRQCLSRARAVTVRERRAQQVLEEVGVRQEIQVTADPAFLLEPEPLSDDALRCEGIDTGSRTIGVSVREPGVAAPDIDEAHYHGLLANAADYMVDRLDARLVFVPMERKVQDLQQSHRVIAQMAYADRATVLKGELTPGQVLSLMSRFEFVVGMRLHFLIFATLQGVPFVALPYASKVTGLLEALEMPAPLMQEVKIGQLIAQVDRSWDMRFDWKKKIEQVRPQLQERARQTQRIVDDVLREHLEPVAADAT